MKKVRMIVEMDEELYKAFAEQDVFISGMRTGKTLLSEIWKALKNATIVRMSEEKIKESCSLSLVYNEGFDKGYEKAEAEYKPKECDDAVSRQAVMQIVEISRLHLDRKYDTEVMSEQIKALPFVLPKREQGEWIEVHPLQEDDGGAYMCSKCRCGHPCIDPDYWKYCPNCGAEMRRKHEYQA